MKGNSTCHTYTEQGRENHDRTFKKKWEHIFATCDCGEGPCNICGGGLAFCTMCNGAEGSLTTDCCGRPITPDEEDKIYKQGSLDFRKGEWVPLPNYKRPK